MQILTVPDLAGEMHVDKHTLYELARREEDPLPLKMLPGKSRGAMILWNDFEEWWGRNAVPLPRRES